ncbi:COX aromatic rich motif-containing protein [Acidithiobacillus sp. M4-SHS-6]|uniref:COX aromatic rich motif-containing protein n=1 Tax=Acidithiobacillus sp. M4-SHS-6 TaxID=3383024 RepID=UPI0039BEBEC8
MEKKWRNWLKNGWRAVALAPILLLSGCASNTFWIFDPKGIMAKTNLFYLIVDVLIMGAIVGLTALLVIWFMWRYQKGKNRGKYDPHWSHSNTIEVFVWGIPIIAVGFLSYFAVKGTFEINPYNPTVITRHMRPGGDPVEVDVIATDWQWLFVYPQYHMAVANELVLPIHTPVFFRLTSSAVTTTFFIPQLVGMIDVMPGMRTKNALMSDHIGEYQGIASDYAGAGTSWMTFKTKMVSTGDFSQWVQQVQKAPGSMSYASFNRFAQPYVDVHHHVLYFSSVEPGLFDHVMAEVMRGKTWPLPPMMTENMVGYMQKQAAEHRD